MSKEFYGVIINIGASKKSTIGYRQYLVYKNTINDNIDIIGYKQDSFIYIVIERYTFKEFYSVIINISASKKFTIGYRQYRY